MKKILNTFLFIFIVFLISGCNSKKTSKNLDNELTCKGDYLLSVGVMYVYVSDGNDSYNDTPNHMYFTDDATGYGTGEYIFYFKNDKVKSIKVIEKYNKELSNYYSETDESSSLNKDCAYVKENDIVILKCDLKDDDMITLLNKNGYTTKTKLKEYIEENTSLTCN